MLYTPSVFEFDLWHFLHLIEKTNCQLVLEKSGSEQKLVGPSSLNKTYLATFIIH